MPSPWKKTGVARLISGLRSNRAAGAPLVVETGFPTSLADLVVKNRARLKMPSRKKKPDPHDAAGTLALSPLGGAAPAPAIAGCPPPRLPAGEESRCPAPAAAQMKRRGYGFMSAKLLVLVILAVGKKELVAGVTISAFALVILDFLGFRVFGFLRPCADARRSMNSVEGGLDLNGREWASPIREVGADSSGSESSREVSAETRIQVSPERRDLAVAEKVCEDRTPESSGNPKAKKKKLWRKFVPKKFRRGSSAGSKDGNEEVDSGSSTRSASDCSRKYEDELPKEQQEEEQSSEEVLSYKSSNKVSFVDAEDVEVIAENLNGTRVGSYKQLVFLVMVLFGLMGGRVVALVIAMVGFLLAKTIQAIWRRWMVERADSFL